MTGEVCVSWPGVTAGPQAGSVIWGGGGQRVVVMGQDHTKLLFSHLQVSTRRGQRQRGVMQSPTVPSYFRALPRRPPDPS